MNTKRQPSCAVPECTQTFDMERHFFRFPKEHDRWVQWVRACGRFDLEPKGPKYSYENVRLCHLHFQRKWYRINKIRARLHPDAVPTIFFGPHFKQDFYITKKNVSTEKEELHRNICTEVIIKDEEEENSNAETSEIILPTCHSTTNNLKIEIMKPYVYTFTNVGTSAEEPGNVTTRTKKLLDDSPKKRKLYQRIKKLKAQNRKLRETIRRLRMKEKIYKIIYKIILK
ncbi:52 kDa repressor of the inhibitor of the protein kinase-like [Xylocopa sonorina]|uniref:52 kDa repressor of the inhibitor of the protein kinase-like n=1 Tax=Xylocopa sonorina TaxID=1818115 RepID=UPI00403AC812